MSVTDKLTARLPSKFGGHPEKPVVAVVKLHGVITPAPTPVSRNVINTSSVESALTRAFGHERLQAVALAVNSPGGAPTQSALVADRIRELAAEKQVPVLAFCEDVAASGGYWLACAADEVYAHATSLVGSIGVVSSGFGVAGLMERIGVERRLHTAGKNKVRLDPFSPEKEDDVAWLGELQSELHDQFTSWVKQRRGGKLSDAEELFTGEVWTGAKAAELGLVDGVGTLRQTITSRYPDADIVVSEGRKPLLARLGLGGPMASRFGGGPADTVLAALDALDQRSQWSRFGL